MIRWPAWRYVVLSWLTAGLVAASNAAASIDAAVPSTIKIDGTVDAGIYQDLEGERGIGSIQPSNIAISGSSQLGNDSQSIFRLSARFRMQDGQLEDPAHKPFWHDEATIGIRGPAGVLRFGRGLDAAYSQDWQFDLWSYLDKVASPAWDIWHYNYPSDPHANNDEAEYGRLNGGVYYDSPSMDGLSLHLSTVPAKRPGDEQRPLGMSLTYQTQGLNTLVSAEKNSEGDHDWSVALALTGKQITWSSLFNVSTAGSSRARALTSEIQYSRAGFTYKTGLGVLTVDRHQAESVVSLGIFYQLSAASSVYLDDALKHVPAGDKSAYGMGITHSF
jgi:predicted porin